MRNYIIKSAYILDNTKLSIQHSSLSEIHIDLFKNMYILIQYCPLLTTYTSSNTILSTPLTPPPPPPPSHLYPTTIHLGSDWLSVLPAHPGTGGSPGDNTKNQT